MAAAEVFAQPPHHERIKDEILRALYTGGETTIGALNRIGSLGESMAAHTGLLADVMRYIQPDESVDVQCAALAALGRMGQIGALQADEVLKIARAGGTEEARRAAIESLGLMAPHSERYVKDVVRLLRSESVAEIREAAVTSLGAMKAFSYRDDVLKCLEDESAAVASAAARALGVWKDEGAGNAADIAKLLAHQEGGVRASAIQSLGEIGGDAGGKHAGKVADLLVDPDNVVRQAAVRFFEVAGEGAGDQVADNVAKGLSSEDGRFLASSAIALGHMKAGKHAPAVAKLLGSGYEDDASVALSAACIEPRLPTALRRPACGAAIALGLMGEAGQGFAGEIAGKLDGADPEAAVCFARALGMMGAAGASHEAKVCVLLNSVSGPVRAAACDALGEFLKVDNEADAAWEVVEKLQDPHPAVRRAAVKAIGNMEDEGMQHTEGVLKLFSDPVVSVKIDAIKAMGSLGEKGQMYAAAICRTTSDENEKVRCTAVEVLASMGERGAAFAEEMSELLEDPSGDVRKGALKALILSGEEARPFGEAVSKLRSDPLDYVRAAAEECEKALAVVEEQAFRGRDTE